MRVCAKKWVFIIISHAGLSMAEWVVNFRCIMCERAACCAYIHSFSDPGD